MKEYVYSPHYEFYIDKVHRQCGYDMQSFHVHKKYEIYYQAEGTRRYYINDGAYLINAGNIVLIGPDGIHKTSSVDNSPHTRYVLNFSREYLEDFERALPDSGLFACFSHGLHVLSVPPKKQAIVEGLMGRIWENRDNVTPLFQGLRKLQIGELLLHLEEYACDAKDFQSEQERTGNKTIEKIQSYISIHYKSDLTLQGISAQFYLSPSYLSRLFKRTTNLGLVEYINSVRIMAAKNLLENTTMRVPIVAEETGFSTTAHFGRVFKQSTGLSPQQYRKYYQSATPEDRTASSGSTLL